MNDRLKAASHAVEWDDLKLDLSTMAKESGRRMVYVPNTGNAGDALIASGAWQLFDQIGIAPTICRTREIRAGDIAIYAGGGNLVPEYKDCSLFLQQCLDVGVAKALVLPHTIRGYETLLGRLDNRFFLYCRDFD